MDGTSTVILFNGVGSVGKSSIAKALQTIATEPFLHVEMDAFLNMMPERFWDHPDGLTFETVMQDSKPTVAIKSGSVTERTLRGMRHAVAAMARQGNNLIIDDVLLEDEMADYIALLAGFTFHTVGIFAPLDVLEARERERGDRLIGLARWQYDRVHQGKRYDLELDASAATPMQCAEAIKATFGL
ncbi:chloramphenicol phosphotransferase CPT family protein [Dongia deserti]|uniref:chloramphenicol phosphotransferase CPT family protein n=1 Tax=Dongia deserti TaxID=2268030 RepID=UPI000E64FAFD|nr:AAA family ATPase [Dongia deserti]